MAVKHRIDPAIVLAAKRGDDTARDWVLRRMIPLTRATAWKTVRPGANVDDMAQMALIEVNRGIDTFSGDGDFVAYVYRSILGACLRESRGNSGVKVRRGGRSRDPRPFVMEAEPYGDHVWELIDPRSIESAVDLRDLVSTEPNPERTVLLLYYGLHPDGPLGFQEIGQRIGLYRSYVSEMVNRSLCRLRQRAGIHP
jgi:RNA polymerase sigma factor (sigma-70 family)